jgi:hypothetical protein
MDTPDGNSGLVAGKPPVLTVGHLGDVVARHAVMLVGRMSAAEHEPAYRVEPLVRSSSPPPESQQPTDQQIR